MASSIFKQQCPTCEAMVPIKDRTLVGKKIDCPKCKARFVVEDPDGGAADAEKDKKKGKAEDKAAPKAKGKPKKKIEDDYEEDEEGLGRPQRKKKPGSGGGSSKMIIGVSLGVLVVGMLAVAGFFMFGGEEKKPAVTPGGGGGGVAAAPAAGGQQDVVAEQPQEKKAEDAKKSAAFLSDVTNLLPSDTEIVMNLALQDVFRSSLGKISADLASMLEAKDDWREAGISPDSIERLLAANSVSKQWGFMAVRVNKPIKLDVLRKLLNLQPAGAPIRGQEYFVLKNVDFLKVIPGISPQQLAMLSLTGQANKSLGLRLHDEQTLVMADLDQMKRFLEGGDTKPQPQEKPKDPAGASGDAAPGQPQQGPGGNQQNMQMQMAAAMQEGRRQERMANPSGSSGAAGGNQPAPTPASNSYQTLNPRLKVMLDKMEAKPFLLSLAVDVDSMKLPAGASPAALFANNPMANQMKIATLGFAIQAEGGVGAIAGVECKDMNTVTLLDTTISSGMFMAIQWVKDALNLGVDWDQALPMAGGFPGGAAPGGLAGSSEAAGGVSAPGASGQFGMNQAQMMQQRMGRQGMGQPGMPQPGMGQPGMAQGVPGAMPGLPQDEKTNGKLTVTGPIMNEQTLIMSVKIDAEGLNYLYEEYVLENLLLAKGAAEMLMKHPQPHDLAQAAKLVADRNQAYPRGTYDRPQAPGRNIRPWLPDQRVSWIAETLPFLGYTELHGQIVFDKSWRDPDNKRPAMTIVPFFLNPNTKNETWHIHASGLNKQVAASHYVGVAGVGLDAADYDDKNPATAKKRGIFGYDRRTPIADLPDGASTTIMILQIPPETRGPWLAGGGSTVRGVPETNSVKPFVSAQRDGQKGTFALMADGSVRFVPDTINDKVFQSLCVVDKDKSVVGIDETILVPRQTVDLKAQPTPPPAVTTAPAVPPAEATSPTATPAPAAEAPAPALEWKEYTSVPDKFSVLMPGPVKEDKESLPTPLGNIEKRTYYWEGKGWSCEVICVDVQLPAGQEEAFYSTFLQSTKATAKGQKPITLGNLAGREYEMDRNGKAFRARVYLANGKFYAQWVPTAGMPAAEIDKFLGSLKVLN